MNLQEKNKSISPHAILAIVLIASAIFALRLSGPDDLMALAQHRQIAPVMDVLFEGHWIHQFDANGNVASKPPMYTWLAALVCELAGDVNRFTLSLPSALATLVLAILICILTTRYFGRSAGWMAGIAYLITPLTVGQMALIRTDAVFTLAVCLTALAGWRAWNRGHGWTWFWLAAAMATLTKGPLGLLLGAGGLLVIIWERRRRADESGMPGPSSSQLADSQRSILASHALGIILFVLITGGWFALAYAAIGQSLVDKLIWQELFGHAVSHGSRRRFPLIRFYEAPYRFLLGFAPWSIATLFALWRVAVQPACDRATRRLERFLFCWFMAGLAMFCIAPVNRPDHILPLLPAAAMLAGRELQLWRDRLKAKTFYPIAATATVVVMAVILGNMWMYAPRNNRTVRTSIEMKQLARELAASVEADFPFTYVDAPFSLQFHLKTMRRHTDYEQAAELLHRPTPAFVLAQDYQRLLDLLPEDKIEIHVLDLPVATTRPLWLVSNHPRLERTDTVATISGPLRIDLNQARLASSRRGVFNVRGESLDAEIVFFNLSEAALTVRVRTDPVADPIQDLLEPGQQLVVQAPIEEPPGVSSN
jgi:4-amino-4-deoxy-L-arabinose transferase-like glycosyltransferase